MLKDLITKRDAIALLELIHECVSCDDEERFRVIIGKMQALFSHDYAISVMAETGKDGILKSYDAMNLSYPSEWIAMYIAQREHEHDPVLRANYQNFRLQYFEDILKQYDYPKDRKAVANDFGIVDGYVHGVRYPSGCGGSMFCFAGRKMDRDKRTEIILELLTPHLHEAFLRIISRTGNGSHTLPVALSRKEKEVLKWLAQVKSTWDISVLLGISERTVKFHIGNIMKKLDASTRAHPVAIAIEQGLVEIY